MWLLRLAVPNDSLQRDRLSLSLYYACWGLFAGTTLTIQYQIMAHAGHARQALLSDGIALGLFLLGHAGVRYLRRRRGGATSPVH
jgi:hypothetical protein